jgi:sterol desaturase/sphingolipid hydroxylase (fatty acid hydroxylase superfamily)
MMEVKIMNLKKVSLGWAVVGAFGGIAALSVNPLLMSGAVRGDILKSILGDLEDYLFNAFGAFGLFWVGAHRWIAGRQIARKRWPRLPQIGRELAFSFSSQLVMAAVAIYIVTNSSQIMANMTPASGVAGWAWAVALTLLLFAIEDTFFYWTHRAMHHPKLFRHFHAVHHESYDPTPFTAYSFHPLEAIVQSLNGLPTLLPLIFLPWDPLALAVYGFGQIAFNVIGHLGYEVYPANWNRLPGLRWKTPGLHHYLHHQMVGGNYGLYFRWWDKYCGTEFADFEARYDRIFNAPSSPSQASLHTISTRV